ncbi:hypothetical protein M422DRAFT_263343 [Sphaerobolus stellatus SS14]|uniref:Uncharacterized protein n=1 Tax=Sphaerobolus stellatus (strain SS14) TaxID=990650 RepID=A0A0C9UZ43_SPHS4|nr:hypothetical protein M422DRAFT_263343 [Sphaerobolus stellatus SS14]
MAGTTDTSGYPGPPPGDNPQENDGSDHGNQSPYPSHNNSLRRSTGGDGGRPPDNGDDGDNSDGGPPTDPPPDGIPVPKSEHQTRSMGLTNKLKVYLISCVLEP